MTHTRTHGQAENRLPPATNRQSRHKNRCKLTGSETHLFIDAVINVVNVTVECMNLQRTIKLASVLIQCPLNVLPSANHTRQIPIAIQVNNIWWKNEAKMCAEYNLRRHLKAFKGTFFYSFSYQLLIWETIEESSERRAFSDTWT